MRFGDRSDEELIALAQAGWAPAFAVLVHRYASTVHAARTDTADPVQAVTTVFLQAMRQLPERDPRASVTPWLLALAGARTTSPPTPAPLSAREIDAVWAELHQRWPHGHRPARRVPWQRGAAVVGLAALAGLVPAVVLGADGPDAEEDLLELRAVPMPDERAEQVDHEPEDDEAEDFTFPATPEEQEPAPEPEPEPGEPAEPADPEPAPDPDEDPEGADEDAATEPEDDEGEGDDGEGDNGLLDDLVGGDEGDDPDTGDDVDGEDVDDDESDADDTAPEEATDSDADRTEDA